MSERLRGSRFRRWLARKLKRRGTATRLSAHLHHARNWASRYVNGEFDIDFDTAAAIVAFFGTTMDDALGSEEDSAHTDGELDRLRTLWVHLHPLLRRALLDDARFYASLPQRLAK